MEYHNTFSGPNSGFLAGQVAINNSTFNIGQQAPPDLKSECLQSLYFKGMPTLRNIKERAEGTCQWIFDHEQYKTWLSQGGMLWVQGRAGSGKSTLMDHLVGVESQSEDAVVLSYFFHKAGEEMQKSMLGMCRALLYQLLEKNDETVAYFLEKSEFARRCQHRGKPGDKWDWTEIDVKSLLEKCLHTYRKRILVFVDAVNESGEDSASMVIRYFRRFITDTECGVRICISCRPRSSKGAQYVFVQKDEFSIDIETENRSDISEFLGQRFALIENSQQCRVPWKGQVMLFQRASCVFQWISWIIGDGGPVLRLLQREEPIEYILQRIEGFPQELAAAYRSVLNGIDLSEVGLALRLFEWLTLAHHPFTTEELRHAICLDEQERYKSVKDLQESRHFCKTGKQLIGRLSGFSSGLVRQIKLGDTEEVLRRIHRRSTPSLSGLVSRESVMVLHFDHESVYEFMLQEGLQLLQSRIMESAVPLSVAQKHLLIARRCLQYLHLEEVIEFDFTGTAESAKLDDKVVDNNDLCF